MKNLTAGLLTFQLNQAVHARAQSDLLSHPEISILQPTQNRHRLPVCIRRNCIHKTNYYNMFCQNMFNQAKSNQI